MASRYLAVPEHVYAELVSRKNSPKEPMGNVLSRLLGLRPTTSIGRKWFFHGIDVGETTILEWYPSKIECHTAYLRAIKKEEVTYGKKFSRKSLPIGLKITRTK